MDNKQIIHIATEVITIIGITIYFSRQNKKLYENIEVLTNNLNEQTEIIKKHENMINNLLETVQRLISQQQLQNSKVMNQFQNSQFMKDSQPQMIYSTKNSQVKQEQQTNPISQIEIEEPSKFLAVQFIQTHLSPKKSHKVEEIIEDDEDNEDEKIVDEELLDDELADELKELEE